MTKNKTTVKLEEMPDVMTARQVHQLLPMFSRTTLYELLGDGTLPAKKIKGQYVISKRAFQRFLEEMR